MKESRYSFKLLSKAKALEAHPDSGPNNNKDPDNTEIDSKKRTFLKLAGVVGVGAAATMLMPKKASALVFGSGGSSGASTVGVKDASNNRINPATQETLAGIKAQTDLLSFDSPTNPANLKVNVAAGSLGLLNKSGLPINPATDDTLTAISAVTSQMVFNPPGFLQTTVGGTGNTVGLKDTTSTAINPATDDSLVYLRRMVKLMESQATVDQQNRQKIIVDGFGAVTFGAGGPGGAGIPRVTISNDSTFSANIGTFIGWGDQMFTDIARTAYANGIRANFT